MVVLVWLMLGGYKVGTLYSKRILRLVFFIIWIRLSALWWVWW